MKLIVTGVYSAVIAAAMAVAFGIFEGGADVTLRAFVCGMLVFFAVLQIGEQWHNG